MSEHGMTPRHSKLDLESIFFSVIPAKAEIYYNQLMRINKYIASSTKYSRRKAEELVLAGKIRVNNNVIRDLSTQIESTDKVYLANRPLTPKKLVYYALNKPVGYTTTTSDSHAERIITELVPKDPPVFPVGRLDKNTSGLIFLTNDGDFAQKMTHPKYEKEKEYIVETDKLLSKKSIDNLRNGIKLTDGITAPAKVSICHSDRHHASGERRNPFPSSHSGWAQNLYSITIHEGRNRQIRRMIETVGAKVISLKRIRIGDFDLGDLEKEKYKIISPRSS